MRIQQLFFLVGLMFVSTSIFAQSMKDTLHKDSHPRHIRIKTPKKTELKNDDKYLRCPSFYRFQWANGYYAMNNNHSALKIGPNVGTGLEFLGGHKINQSTSFGLGINIMAFNVDQSALYQDVKSLYTSPETNLILVRYHQTSLSKTGLFAYTSKWYYRQHSVFEIYGKLAATHSSYKIDYIAFRNDKNSHFSEYFILKDKYKSWGVMPSVGIHSSFNITSALYFTCGGEYGYNFCSSRTIKQQQVTSLGLNQFQSLNVPMPVHFVQINIGLMIHPFNRIKPSEPEFQQEEFERKSKKNN